MLANMVELDRKWNRAYSDPTLYQEPTHRPDVDMEKRAHEADSEQGVFKDFNETAKNLMRERIHIKDEDAH
jgi:hypothetical protein